MPHRPLQALAFLVGLWLALVAVGPLGFTAPPERRESTGVLEAERAALAAAVDAARTAVGAPCLPRRAGLEAAAQSWSRHLLVTASPRPDAALRPPPPGEGPARWNAAVLAPGQGLGEAVARWLAEPASRARLLDPDVPAMGIGVSRRADGGRLVVQVYAESPSPAGR